MNLFQNAQTSNPTPTTSLLAIPLLFALLAALIYIRKDYHAFLSLGPGGIPSTPTGYIHQCLLRPFALRDPLIPPPIPATLTLPPQSGFLPTTMKPTTAISKPFPTRPGPRPTVKGLAPQRQTTQQGTKTSYDVLSLRLRELVHAHASTHALYTATSCFEKHSTGIFCHPDGPFSRDRDEDGPVVVRAPSSCPCEVCHAHPSDGSLHLSLHPADMAVVLERGWGQRHPLAVEGGLCWGFVRTVPVDFVMVYAPRDEAEMEVVLEIVRAAIAWVGGKALV